MLQLRFSLLILIGLLVLSGCKDALNKDAIVDKYTDSASRFLALHKMQVHYRDEGKGQVVVLLHGTASSLHTWDQWSEKLSQHYRVIRLDLPGFGLTGPHPDDLYEVSDDVAFLNDFLSELKIPKAHIVGSSLGGRIAWQYSLQHSEQVLSLTLMNALGYPQHSWPPAIEMAQWPVLDTLIANFSPRFMFNIGLKEIYYNDHIVDDLLVDRYYELVQFPGNMHAFPKRVKADLDTHNAAIKNISVPTLIQWGEEDKYFPVKRAYDFYEDIKGAKLVTYEQVGHLPMEELPEKSVADFMIFLECVNTNIALNN
jgi:pimeloyl-ACP methyl ester carboxylesterase